MFETGVLVATSVVLARLCHQPFASINYTLSNFQCLMCCRM